MTADVSPMTMSTLAFEPPIPRLFGAPLVEPNALRTNQIGVVGMPSDWTHSSRIGTRFGPRALRQATTVWMKSLSVLIGEPLVDAATGLCWRVRRDRWLGDCGDAHISPASVGRTTPIARDARDPGRAVPLALGGDHCNSYPACLDTGALPTSTTEAVLVHPDRRPSRFLDGSVFWSTIIRRTFDASRSCPTSPGQHGRSASPGG
jgi:arginase family enzyme